MEEDWLVQQQIVDVAVDHSQRELTSHGSFSFPFAAYYDILHKKTLGFVNWHWHNELQYCLVLEGPVTFSVDHSEYTLAAGSGILINARRLHMARSRRPGKGVYLCFDFSPRLLSLFRGSQLEKKYVKPLLENPDFTALPLEPEIPWQKAILDKLRVLYAAYRDQRSGYELSVISLLLQCWSQLVENTQTPAVQKTSVQRHQLVVREILDYIAKHYSENFTMDDIGAAVNYSGAECCRMFKSALNETIYQYLNVYRLERAAELLRQGNHSISQVAYETGFCSASYFIKCFKSLLGQTPLQYRKNWELGASKDGCPQELEKAV